jgi:hypothetical protein
MFTVYTIDSSKRLVTARFAKTLTVDEIVRTRGKAAERSAVQFGLL